MHSRANSGMVMARLPWFWQTCNGTPWSSQGFHGTNHDFSGIYLHFLRSKFLLLSPCSRLPWSFTCFCKFSDTFNKTFSCNIQKLNASDIVSQIKTFSRSVKIFHAEFQFLHAIKILSLWSFTHFTDFLLCLLKGFICKRCLSSNKNRTFQQPLSEFLIEKQKFWRNTLESIVGALEVVWPNWRRHIHHKYKISSKFTMVS